MSLGKIAIHCSICCCGNLVAMGTETFLHDYAFEGMGASKYPVLMFLEVIAIQAISCCYANLVTKVTKITLLFEGKQTSYRTSYLVHIYHQTVAVNCITCFLWKSRYHGNRGMCL